MCNTDKSDLGKVISKIKKLLALSESPNQHEAERASVMAFELMAKYSIEMSTIENTQNSEILQEDLISSGRLNKISWAINTILSKYFYVQLAKRRVGKVTHLAMYGKRHRIEIAKHVFHFLYASVERAWVEYSKNIQTSSRQETMDRKFFFQKGFLQGVTDKLEESKRSLQQQGLVLAKDHDLEEFFKKGFSTRKVPSVYRPKDQHGDQANGYTSGKKTDIFSPVTTGQHYKKIAI